MGDSKVDSQASHNGVDASQSTEMLLCRKDVTFINGAKWLLISLCMYGSILAGHQVRFNYHERRDCSGSRSRRLTRLTRRDFLDASYSGQGTLSPFLAGLAKKHLA
jgi:hypothetical protein